jgi:hypothetical protein
MEAVIGITFDGTVGGNVVGSDTMQLQTEESILD